MSPRPRHAWRRCVACTAPAEVLGFAVPGLVWFLGEQVLHLPALALFLTVVTAGAGEGAVLGFGQHLALQRLVPGIGRRDWVGATAAGAGVAWTLGMVPSTLYDLGLPTIAIIAVAVPGAIVLLNSIGISQWLVLRRHLPRAWRWVPANAAAWLAGLPVTFVAPALVPDGSPSWAFAVAWGTAGVVMATAIAMITGVAIVRLTRRTVEEQSGAPSG